MSSRTRFRVLYKFCFAWYPNDITLCLWSKFMYPRIRTLDRKTFSWSLFQKQAFKIHGFDSWNVAEVNFFRRKKLSRRDYLDYLKNKAKSGDMAVLALTSEDANGKTESWRNTYRGVDLKKMRFVPGGFSCTNSPTSCTWRKVVDWYNRNIFCLPKHHIRISRVFATLMRPIVRNTGCDSLF